MEMIESAARAVCQHFGIVPDHGEGTFVGPRWREFVPVVRAVLEAMREPTEEMIRAAHADEAFDEANPPAYFFHKQWPLAIDAALETKEAGAAA